MHPSFDGEASHLVNPLKAAMRSTARLLARMHHGKVTGYAAYVLGILMVVLLAAAIKARP